MTETETITDVDDGDEPQGMSVWCCLCGNPTTRDPIYGDLCYRCCRAENE